MDIEKSNDADEIIKIRRFEGTWLAQITPPNKSRSNQEAFSAYFLMFAKRHNFTPIMASFVNRTHGPEWFTKKFPATGKKEAESKKVWEAFLTQNIFLTRLGTSKENVKILCYQPNLVSRQFGVSKIVPKPFFNRKSELCLCTFDYSEDEYLQRLTRHVVDRVVLTPFSFQPTFYCTKEFDTWWRAYHAK